jgi:predicted MFS family arabinose efflux permease
MGQSAAGESTAGRGIAGWGELRRNWRILPPSLAGITLCSVHGYSLGVMIPAIEREFGWPRAEISAGLLIISVIALVAAPLVGAMVDRFGPRRIALVGIPFFCLALAALATAGSLTSWWLLWGVLAVGNMMILPTVWTKAINARFDAKRGIALAFALCGTGVAAAFVPSLTNLLIESLGWRQAYVCLGLIGAVIVFPIVWVMFRVEGDGRRTADGAPPPPETGVSARDGLTQPRFLKLAGAILLFSTGICALTTNLVPVLLARGFSGGTAAALAGMLGIGSITGRLVGGLLLDRFDAGKVAAISVVMPVIAVLLLLSFPGAAVAGLACLIVGLAVGTEVDCCAYLAARHFGLRSFGTLFGTINGLMLFGNGMAPVLANHVYDVTKSYDIVLWAQIPACLATALLFLALGPYPQLDEAPGPAQPARADPAAA